MSHLFQNSRTGQRWELINFVSKPSGIRGMAMLSSMLEIGLFEAGGGHWAGCWDDLAKKVVSTCTANKSKVAHLRISCHGDDGAFALGRSVFAAKNAPQWRPIVSQIASYFVPRVSFVTIDACRVAQDSEVLGLFSEALGGVAVRGYMEVQTKSTSEENDRGDFVTCHMENCRRTGGL
ncbi:MAG: hypothetical protein OEL76_05180 [Siculibacillus sp.]|nr:hypothetical protein [Siculibacillus sp.]